MRTIEMAGGRRLALRADSADALTLQNAAPRRCEPLGRSKRRKVADPADHVTLDGILQLPPAFLPVLHLAGCCAVHGRCLLPRLQAG
jgi:hypothetical protein